MSASKVLFYFCLFFVAGVFVESIINTPQFYIWGVLILAVFGALAGFLNYKKAWVLGFCAIFFVFGVLRMQIAEFDVAGNKLAKLNGQGQAVLIGTVYDEPDIREKSQNLKVKVQDSIVLVTTSRYPEYKYFDKIEITGKLEAPKQLEDFNYKNYLMKDGIYSVMAFPKIAVLGAGKKNIFEKFYSGILFVKDKLRKSIRASYSPPHSLILEGTVVGDNGVLSEELKGKLNSTGLRHVIAVSGTHIVILSAILMSFLLMLGLWRRQAFYFSIILIWLYIVLTGLNSSGVRAGIMGSLFLVAQMAGRQSAGLRTIAIAGALMTLQNPLLLLFDIGFQLSFLAALGIIFLTPMFNAFFDFVKKKILPKSQKSFENLSNIVSQTLAAQIFTLPILLYNFGNISFVAPITNLLVLPMVPLMMVLGFVSSIAGIFSTILGRLASVPCWILLEYFLKVMDIFSQPWAMKTFENVHWAWLIILYFIIISGYRFLIKKLGKTFT